MYGLVDCDSFYVSCERLFRPDLACRPVVVLSNNDGCIIAMSMEVKKLGLTIGQPYFKFKRLFRQNNVAVFSANFALYGDISARIMNYLQGHLVNVEIYSIDEAFFELTPSMPELSKLGAFINSLRAVIMQWFGIPVSISLGATKTLAKVANRLAKHSAQGTCSLINRASVRAALASMKVRDIWGIGRSSAACIQALGAHSALDFRELDKDWVRRNLGIVGLRMQRELHGEVCHQLNNKIPRKSITHSRTFPQSMTKLPHLLGTVCQFVANAAQRLRSYGLRAGVVGVILGADKHGKHFDDMRELVRLPQHSSDTLVLSAHAKLALEKIYSPKHAYKRSGIILLDLVEYQQGSLKFEQECFLDTAKQQALGRAVDCLNLRYGRNTLQYGWTWRQPRQEKLSPQYTTRRADLCQVR